MFHRPRPPWADLVWKDSRGLGPFHGRGSFLMPGRSLSRRAQHELLRSPCPPSPPSSLAQTLPHITHLHGVAFAPAIRGTHVLIPSDKSGGGVHLPPAHHHAALLQASRPSLQSWCRPLTLSPCWTQLFQTGSIPRACRSLLPQVCPRRASVGHSLREGLPSQHPPILACPSLAMGPVLPGLSVTTAPTDIMRGDILPVGDASP